MGQALTGIPGRFPGAWRLALCAALFCAVLILSSNTASAVTNPPPPTPQTSHQGFSVSQVQGFFTDEFGDPLTSLFLHQIFGPLFPDKTRGSSASSSTVFSEIIGYFNIVAIGLGGLLFAWNATVGLLQTAHEGELLGRKWSSLWAPLRIVFAVGLLVPLPNLGGYNAAQAAIAYIVRGSTMTASFIWGQSAKLMLSYNVPMAITPPSMPSDLMREMYAIAACQAIVSKQINDANSATKSNNYQVTRKVTTVQLTPTLSKSRTSGYLRVPNGQYVEICGYWETPAYDTNIAHFLRERGIVDGSAEEIGQIYKRRHNRIMEDIHTELSKIVGKKVPVILSPDWQNKFSEDHAGDIAKIYQDANTALSEMVTEIFKVVADSPQQTNGALRGVLSKDLLERAITGAPECQAAGGRRDMGDPDKRDRCFGEGWIGAGKWYLTLARINKSLNTFSTQFGKAEHIENFGAPPAPPPAGASPDGGWWSWIYNSPEERANYAKARQQYDTVVRYLDHKDADARMGAFMRSFDRDRVGLGALNLGVSVNPEDIISLTSVEGKGLLKRGAEWLLDKALGASLQDAVDFATIVEPTEDPLLKLMQWGDYFLLITGAASLPLLLAPGGGTLAGIMTVLWGAGALLTIILPMMPWILWVIAVTGYFLVVVEAVLAVALWAFAHLRMDGEGISGHATAGWTMILALLLTPVLMVMGYLVGMVIYRVTSTLLLSGIWPTFHAAMVNATVLTQLLALPALGLLVGVMQIILIERSFSLTTELPNRVLSWIGAKMDLYDSGALDRARVGMIGATAAVSKVGPGAISASGDKLRDQLKRLNRSPGSARRGGEGTDQ